MPNYRKEPHRNHWTSFREIGVDVNQVDWQRRTPLHYASDLSTAKILLVNGASVHAKTYRGQTPLHKAC